MELHEMIDDNELAIFPLDIDSFTYDLIPAACAAIEHAMTERNFIPVSVQVWLGAPGSTATVYNYARVGDTWDSQKSMDGWCKTDPQSVAERLNLVHAGWLAMQSVAEVQREAFLRKLGQLLDQARDLGLAVDFINPLTAMMKQLSENALQHHPAPAAPAPTDDEVPF